jgi:putative methanogenesis marker domain 9
MAVLSRLMLEIGYLSLDNPIAIISSIKKPKNELNRSAGLAIIEGFDLDELSIEEVESSLKEIEAPSALGISVIASEDGTILEAARFASKSLRLLELNFNKDPDEARILDLAAKVKRCGTTLSLKVKPGALCEVTMKKLAEIGLDLIHLDVTGQNGSAPRAVKKVADAHGPRIMAQGDIGDFDDAKDLLSMGAEIVSLNGNTDPEFASWLKDALKECDRLSGWYNAPKHICSGGDLRGLSFCCPPVKHCPVLGALKRAGMTPDEFVERKLSLAKGTKLQYGDGTCFGSLVWCCKITKPCFLRDSALENIGLSGKEYMELKRKLADQLISNMV